MSVKKKEVYLHGFLADKYGEKFSLKCASIREALDLLEANFPGFKKTATECDNYRVMIDKKDVDKEYVFSYIPRAARFDIVPVLHGAGRGSRAAVKFIAAAVLFVASSGLSTFASGATGLTATAATGLASASKLIAGSLFIQGLSVLFAPNTPPPGSQEANKYIQAISGFAAGGGVPICYGEMICGGHLVSAVLESSNSHYFEIDDDGLAENIFTPPTTPESTATPSVSYGQSSVTAAA